MVKITRYFHHVKKFVGWNISIIIIIFSLLHCPKQKGQGGGSTVWDIVKHKWVVNYRVLDQSFSLNLGSNGYNIFMISLLSIYILNLNANIAPMFYFVSLAVCPFLFFFHCSWIIFSLSLFFNYHLAGRKSGWHLPQTVEGATVKQSSLFVTCLQ